MSDEELLASPDFHACMTFGIVMQTLARFEFALGRRVKWSFHSHQLQVSPHAFEKANAFYSDAAQGLFFGYFQSSDGKQVYLHLPVARDHCPRDHPCPARWIAGSGTPTHPPHSRPDFTRDSRILWPFCPFVSAESRWLGLWISASSLQGQGGAINRAAPVGHGFETIRPVRVGPADGL